MNTNEQQTEQHVDLIALVLKAFAHHEAQPGSELQLAFISEHTDADIAHLIESVSDQYRVAIWQQISADRAWSVLHLLNYETARHLVKKLTAEQLNGLQKKAVERDIVTFAEIFPDDFVEDFLDQQEASASELLQNALSYPDESVGRYLNLSILRARPSATVQRTIERINKLKPKNVVGIYVVDSDGVFRGGCNLGQILAAPPETRLQDILVAMELISDSEDMTEAAQRLNPVDGFAWVPVQKNNKIIGAVAVSLLMGRLKERSLEVFTTEATNDEEDLFTPIPVAARMRAIWLVTNLMTAFLASAVIGLFEATVEQVVALAILMPVVASMGGIAGSQTLAVALRGIAMNHLKSSNLKLLLHKEIKIAAVNGVALGVLVAAIVGYWFNSAILGSILFVAIVLNSLAAGASGTIIPFVLKKLRIDPAVAGSVILTTVTDVVGFFVFLGLGTVLISALI
ncbi:magnesium transporter [Neiella sp. HB171785]|uniref:Magnesium transporter n=1 Tax=Neiella litorisoli TaxID=2771431 RepID=A0A8J6QPM1_9GAMM|nr:magnesium transporter [Neiella litorisoli]MBD1388746.1 magnesium transporter [Neiella litorisoli]